MLVEAIFWFHPLVWWIGARLVEERELACDEEVLRLGSNPETYAAGILNVCKFYLESPLPCAPGVTGADLKLRIEAIMTRRMLPGLTLTRKLLLAAAGLAAIAGPIAVGVLHAQSHPPLRFEVATIKPLKNEGGRGGLEILPGGGLHMAGTTLKGLIAFAYEVREERIAGGPKWIDTDSYELIAKPERPAEADSPKTPVAPGTTGWDRLRERLRNLLAERFQLKLHTANKDAQIYALVVGKDGFKLKPSEDLSLPAGTNRNIGVINGRNGTITMLAAVLTGYTGRHVEDRTGITGAYTYKLEYAQEGTPGTPPDPSAMGASIFSALQEQLGLKLESVKGTIPSLVIDSASKPSAN